MNTLLIAKYFPPVVGGSTRWYHEIYSRYDGSHVFVLTEKTPGWQDYDSKSKMRIHRQESWGWASLHPKHIHVYLKIALKAYSMVRKNGISVIHCDKVLPSGMVGYCLSALTGIPCYIYVHGEEIKHFRQLFPEKQVMSFVYQHVTGLITNSQFTRNLLLELGVEAGKIHLIHPGVDPNVFRPRLACEQWQSKLGLKGDHLALTVGRLDERKGHDQVIRALPFILKKIPNLRYLIAGTGQEEARLKQLSRSLSLAEHVEFLGFVEDELLPSLYNVADIFVMPNRETESNDVEGFGIVFLEASACEKPVIAGRSGGTENAVLEGSTGLLVDGNNIDEIAAAVIRLLEDRHFARQLGKNGRQRTIEQFDWTIGLQKIQELK